MVKNGRDYIYLAWQNPTTRKKYIVGELSKNGLFEFMYGFEVKEAEKDGFKLLVGFSDIQAVYKNNILFPVFSSRLPDKKRKNIQDILKKYGLEEFDDYKLLKRSGAKLPIDNLEFIDPIDPDTQEKELERKFYVAGPKYYIGCDGADCKKSMHIENNESLKLEYEPANKKDADAIKIINKNNEHIGYIPRYYCKGIKSLLERNYKYSCIIINVKKDSNCSECIFVEFKLYLEIN